MATISWSLIMIVRNGGEFCLAIAGCVSHSHFIMYKSNNKVATSLPSPTQHRKLQTTPAA